MGTVSIIVPIFNTAPYVRRCLDSLLAQTYTDVEVLAVDDGSTDESPDICRVMADGDARLRYFRIEHGGVSAARNKGLSVMRGEYVCFVDSDDWLEPDALETLVKTMENSSADVVFYNTLKEENGYLSLRTEHPLTGAADIDEMLHQVLCSKDKNHASYGYYLSVNNKLFRVSSLARNGEQLLPFDIDTRILEDGLWLMGQLPGFKKGILCAQGFYRRTYRPDSATGSGQDWFNNSRDYLRSYTRLMGMVRTLGRPQAIGYAQTSLFSSLEIAMRRDARETGGERIAELLALLSPEDREAFALGQLEKWMPYQESEAYHMGQRLYAFAPFRVPYLLMKRLYNLLWPKDGKRRKRK